MKINDLIGSPLLLPEHKRALEWFEENNGRDDVPYTPKVDGIQIVSPAQGIYKPATSDYALTVKETLKGSYPDQQPVDLPNGAWAYLYHQQGDDSLHDRVNLSSNRAIQYNIINRIPVGVFIQTQPKGRKGTQYKVGIALPVGWINGFFILIGAPPNGDIPDYIFDINPSELFTFILTENQKQSVDTEGFFNPTSIIDERKKAMRSIVQRQGQSTFRKHVLDAYKGKCPITGCNVEEALEAAHISPYMGPATNSVQNGLPLRSDIHTLWDMGLICVNPSDMTIIIHPKLQSTEYGKLHGQKLQLPEDVNNAPSKEALAEHYSFCGNKLLGEND